MLMIDHDRRLGPRLAVSRPCKVFEPRSRRYVAGSTCNVSAGGLLVRLDRDLALEAGDRLYVAVAQKRRQRLLRRDDLAEMEVVRTVSAFGGETTVALRFTDAAAEDDGAEPLRRAA